MYDFAQELYFDLEAPGNKSTRNRTVLKFFESRAIMASGIPTIFFIF